MRNPFDRTHQTKPRRFFKPREAQCYKCAMPGLYHCEIAGCGMPMCIKHRIRKAGGNLCAKHKDSELIQQDAVPQSRFKDSGEAVPHDTLARK
jgi:hypothetical protein